ncbi:transcription/translation regulatory transformer protein RfaH [Colwellia sp. 12G3]|uniref:transcription/translation regulatory transformer protein RfaH n=1 Tax=Colwellia sp. 12G3 TaxID=2058299 RepID=UPI0012FF1320|nr:transcription/translation regulatory transformer protein RfaH [Colwellia sp. 12G3]
MRTSWYLLTTKPKNEQRAVENLTAQKIEVYFPKVKQLKKRQGKKLIGEEALFPNYLFVKLDTEKDNFNAIRSTRGVSNFVRFGLNYGKVSNEFINELSSDLNNQAERTNLKTLININKGDELVILDGPLAGLKGVYQCKDGLERSILLLNILGKENKVVIENDDFDKIN